MKNIKLIMTLVALSTYGISLDCKAQKQPQIQEGSVWAPPNVKIDGKEDEWPNPMYNPKKTDGFLMAYNSTSRIYYTVANDDQNLYFVVRGLGTRVIMKSLSGGMVFTISHATDRKRATATDNIAINFPMPVDEKSIDIVLAPVRGGFRFYNEPEYYPSDYKYLKQMDSIQLISNSKLSSLIKEIGVKGIKEIGDPVISVYNETGIRAMMQFTWRQPSYEIAIPLKYLHFDSKQPVKFSYNIKLNASNTYKIGAFDTPDAGDLYLMSTTDLWGEYTLANKP